jgi:hypothetical protein
MSVGSPLLKPGLEPAFAAQVKLTRIALDFGTTPARGRASLAHPVW